MTRSTTRLAAIVTASALGLGVLGFAWDASRFGFSSEAGADRLRADVRHRFDDVARRVEALATRAARDETIVAHIAAAAERPDLLFARLNDIALAQAALDASVTVHAPAGPVGAYRVAAWSGGPAGDLTPAQLASAPSTFVALGAAGLRLVVAQPIESAGRRVAVATAEAIIAPATAPGAESFSFDSSFGPVPVTRPATGTPLPNAFTLSAPSGQSLLDVGIDVRLIEEGRGEFRRRVLVASVLPLFVLLLPVVSAMQSRRSSCATGPWFGWTLALGVLTLLATAGLAGLAAFVATGAEVSRLIWSAGAFALAASIALASWWRKWPRRVVSHSPARFVAEQAMAGVALAGVVWLLARTLGDVADPVVLPRWQLPLLSTDVGTLAALGATLLLEIALGWTAAALLALSAVRWRLGWRRVAGWLAAALWVSPTLALLAPPLTLAPPAVAGAGVAALFALFAGSLRHRYRHASQSEKLVLLFAALITPVLAAYPLAAHTRDRAARLLIEREYGPATAGAQRADRLHLSLALAQREIDAQAGLLALPTLTTGGRVESQAAFRIWSQTSLSRDRVTSDIELFGPDLRLVSRFALNVPQFEAAYEPGSEVWGGTGCQWDAFAEVSQFGAEERRRLHAERGICDAQGRLIGAIVIHVLPDYRALPFVSSADPYFDVVARPAARSVAASVPELEVVVYGWNLQPLFATSAGRVTWALPTEVDDRLYQSRESFWFDLPADSRMYHVYFLSDRAGIYAVGYPRPTVFHHLSRLSELFAITAGFFVLLLAGLAMYAPFAASWRGSANPLRAVLQEIQTSFYRKLFLFFLLAAIGPVLLFAAAFSAYTMARFSADIQSEAASVVTVARRVFEELLAAERHPDQAPARVSDDVMVWIHQVINQDVNLYEGPRLIATSQRDLFDSGLLPTRTPARVYREIALYRAPTFVTPDHIGDFQYLVAAAPVPARGREALLTVPLASRQREVEREIEDLNRGVLVGVVVVVLFAAGLGASVAGRVSDPVSRLTRATRLIAEGRLDLRLVADTADELGRLVEDFNAMAHTLLEQRAELARTNQLKAWAEMARQVAHEIKNPLTPIQLAAEHLRHVHDDARRPLGEVFDRCIDAILKQVRLLRQIAAEFSSFGTQTVARPSDVSVAELVESVTGPYRPGLADRIRIEAQIAPDLPTVRVDRVLVARALANLVENAVQAMPGRGALTVTASLAPEGVAIVVRDTGPGMEPEAIRRAFEPYFSTKTAGSGLGLANAKRNVELCGGTIALTSVAGEGTTVTITLPVAARPGAVAGASPPDQ